MNDAHDMGGTQGAGPVEIEPNEPMFHAVWEGRVFALTLACSVHRKWSVDMSRHARERIPSAEYLAASHYERWLRSLEMLLVERGLLTATELATGSAGAKASDTAALRASDVPAFLRIRRRSRLDDKVAPRFKVGDRVLTRSVRPAGHTRLPRYARGKRGVVDRDHGVFIFADSYATSRDKKPQHCYSVCFAARELWGEDASARDSVYVDLWDDHLEPA